MSCHLSLFISCRPQLPEHDVHYLWGLQWGNLLPRVTLVEKKKKEKSHCTVGKNLCKLTAQGWLAASYASLWVSYTPNPCSGVSACRCSVPKANLREHKAALSVSIWHLHAGMSSFRRRGRNASDFTLVWAGKCKVGHLIPVAECEFLL